MNWTEGIIARAIALQTLARKCVVLVFNKLLRSIWPPAAYQHDLEVLLEYESRVPWPVRKQWSRMIFDAAARPCMLQIIKARTQRE